MAKKKLFGNQKEPRCETCAHGKLSANGESVLCIQGGALPLSHSCRYYQYDPLRRTPKRRPLLDEYSAADFALDEPSVEKEASVSASAPAPEEPVPAAEVASVPNRSTFDHLFEYLNAHDTPDADTILAILNKGYPSEEDIADTQENEHNTPLQEQAAEAAAALDPDASPDIAGDLERLDMATIPAFALTPLTDSEDAPELLLLSDDTADEVVFLTHTQSENEAPLSADDLLFLPKGTPSDHDSAENVGGGFTPLTGE